MTRQRDIRRLRAVARQHDMNVDAYTARAAGDRLCYRPAPVDEFLRQGEAFCPGEYTVEQGYEGDES
jgi:hypothetical protein